MIGGNNKSWFSFWQLKCYLVAFFNCISLLSGALEESTLLRNMNCRQELDLSKKPCYISNNALSKYNILLCPNITFCYNIFAPSGRELRPGFVGKGKSFIQVLHIVLMYIQNSVSWDEGAPLTQDRAWKASSPWWVGLGASWFSLVVREKLPFPVQDCQQGLMAQWSSMLCPQVVEWIFLGTSLDRSIQEKI